MQLLKTTLFTALFFLAKIAWAQDTTIYGTAYNAKYGAVVLVNDSAGPIYIDNLQSWDTNYYEKKVKVTGTLVKRNVPKANKKRKRQVQGFGSSYVLVIVNPKVALASEDEH